MKKVLLLLVLGVTLIMSCQKDSEVNIVQEEKVMNPIEPPPPEGTCQSGEALCKNCDKHYTNSVCTDCAACMVLYPKCHSLANWPDACKEFKPKTDMAKANTSVGFPGEY